jgi:hypothetical protein
MFKYKVTVAATFESKTEIKPKELKAAKRTLAQLFPDTSVNDAGLDDLLVKCGKAVVTIE